MKNNYVLWGSWMLMGFVVQYCTPHSPNNIKPVAPSATSSFTPIVLVNDLSASDPFVEPDAVTLKWLLSHYAASGVMLTGLVIQTDSYAQKPYYSGIIGFDTLKTSGNFIRDHRNKQKNEEARQQLNKQLDTIVDACLRHLCLPKSHQRSDVANALRLSAMAASQPCCQNRGVLVIIASDLLQDIDLNRKEILQPVQFPSNAQIILIGNSPEVDIKALFPGHQVIELLSFQHLQTL